MSRSLKRRLSAACLGAFVLGSLTETTFLHADRHPCSLIWVKPFRHSHNEVQICAPILKSPVRPVG